MTTASVVRRLWLPAAHTSPAAARAAVYEAVVETGLLEILDEALLLTTELVTNGVVHARTELEIEILAAGDGLSVMVLDRHCGPLALTGWSSTAQPRERGRGLFLVDRLASRWGTLHHNDGKGVWFRLNRPNCQTCQPLAGLTTAPGAFGEEVSHSSDSDAIQRRAWLTFLTEAGELLAQSLDVELTLALIPRLIVPRLGLWCAVHTLTAQEELRMVTVTHVDEGRVTELRERLAGAAGAIGEALRADRALVLGPPVDGYAVRLVARGQTLGVMTVGRRTPGWPYTDHLALIEDVARRAALAMDNARIHADLRQVAMEFQRSLLPLALPKAKGIAFGAEYVPAGEGAEVGGDFYDVIRRPNDQWLVAIGDVSGNGIHVATVTGLVRDVTRALVRDGRPLRDILSGLNETLLERAAGRFCTVAFAEIGPPVQGSVAVRLHLAGHDQPIHIRADGTASFVGLCGTALGLLSTVRSPELVVALRPGEMMIFYTSGVTGRRCGADLFGAERLRREAADLAGYPAEVVAARLRASTLAFSPDSPADDIAIFVIRNDGLRTPKE